MKRSEDPRLSTAPIEGLGLLVRYDPPEGRSLNGTFMGYGMPVALDMPDSRLKFRETESPANPLGVKGVADLPPVAVADAVMDVLSAAGEDMAGAAREGAVGSDRLPRG